MGSDSIDFLPSLEPNAVIRFLEDRIARFAVPRYLEFVDELPLTENGKVKKYMLKEWGVSPETWDRDESDINRRA